MLYRKASMEDISTLIELRKTQLLDEGVEPINKIDDQLKMFFEEKLSNETLIEWLAIEENEVISTAGIIFYQFPPVYTNSSGIKGYIVNVYTKPKYRRQGLATFLLSKVLEDARKQRVNKIFLIASQDGKKLYQDIGFECKDKWMELDLDIN